MSTNLILKVFDSLVLLILKYGGDMLYKGEKINECENRFDTDRFLLLLRHQIRIIEFWNRIVSLPDHHHLKVAYQWLLDAHLEGRVHIALVMLKVIYHPLYGLNNYVLIWGDWLSCDPLRGSHDSHSPHKRKHLCPILWQL